MTPTAPKKTAKITRIHPEGSTLTRANGAALAPGDIIEEGAALTHATPDGAAGCLSLSAQIAVEVRTVRLPEVAVVGETVVAGVVDEAAKMSTSSRRGTGLGMGGPIAVKRDV